MQDPVDTVRAFYAALGRGDVPGLMALLDPDVRWTEAERFPYYAGEWRGPNAVLEGLLKPLARDWEGFLATPSEFIAQGDRVVALGRYAGANRATGRRFDAAFAHVWTVRDERLARFDMHTDTAKALEAVAA